MAKTIQILFDTYYGYTYLGGIHCIQVLNAQILGSFFKNQVTILLRLLGLRLLQYTYYYEQFSRLHSSMLH